MLRFALSGAVVALGCAVVWAAPSTARACGGCFGPTGQPSVVTAHRMAVSLSLEKTTLWDQFEYAGAPEEFVWVLPVAADQDVDIELADQSFFDMLGQVTQITLQAPAAPGAGGGGGGSGFGCGSADALSASGGGPTDERVVVYRQETVGPYETVVVGGETGESLVAWLQERDYAVPDEMIPTIMHYLDQDMAFAALRLRPGAGIQAMQPVRITTPGLMPTFPLRMVAAGIAEEVSLELFVIAEGRYRAESFPNAQIAPSEITYDWDSATFDYDLIAERKLAQDDGRTWLTEYAQPQYYLYPEAYAYTDDLGVLHSPGADWAHATRGLAEPWITRMRAVLPVEALGQDLVLAASDAGYLSNQIFVSNEINRPSALTPPLVVGPSDGGPWQVPLTALVLGGIFLLAVARRRGLVSSAVK